MLLPITVGLIMTMFINGTALLTGGHEMSATFMNFYNKRAAGVLPAYSTFVMLATAVVQLTSSILLVWALVKRFLQGDRSGALLKWGIWMALVSVVLYGFATRMISNHQAAANLFYYTGLLYVLLWYVERQSTGRGQRFAQVKLLPMFFTLLYTMGQPGIQKLFFADEVVPKYVMMFKDTFLAQLPGGIPPFIYMLGVFETLVAVLVVVSLVRLEFLPTRSKTTLSLALLLGSLTFIMLTFGLSILLNYPGATNLVFYAVFCLFFYIYAVKHTHDDTL